MGQEVKEKAMLIKFMKPVGGMAYFEGDVADLNSVIAAPLVAKGYAIMIPDTEYEPENTLAKDLPFRDKLFESGYNSMEMVINAPSKSLETIKGVGKKGAERIKKYFES